MHIRLLNALCGFYKVTFFILHAFNDLEILWHLNK